MPDAEGIAKRLVEILKSEEFNDALKAIYEEKGDLDVRYPKEVYLTAMWLPQVYPCAEVDLSGIRRQNENDFVIDDVYDFDVYWHVQGSGEERLMVELMRYIRAIEDYFKMIPNLLPLPGCAVWTGDSDMSPISKFGDAEPLLKSAIIRVFVRAQR